MEEKMIEGRDAKKSNWLPFVVVVIAAIVLIFASGGESDDASKKTDGETSENAGEMTGSEDMEEKDAASLEGMLKLSVSEGFPSWTPEAKLQDSRIISKTLTVEGNVDEAYLYVDASVADKELSSYHSFYFKLVNSGGHLFRPESLDVEAGEGTTLLFDLRNLPYLPSVPYDESKTPERADLLSLLSDGSAPLVTSFISSLEQGEINELSIYYGCAEGSDCSVTIR